MRKKQKKAPYHKRAHLLVVPHKKNHYIPHLLRGRGLSIFFILVLGLLVLGLAQDKTRVLGTTMTMSQQQLLDQTNSRRIRADVPKLKLDKKLTAAAAMKASHMFKHDYWAHVSPSGVTPWVWFKRAGYAYGYAGENLARGYKTAKGTVTAWMNSPGHRKNMLSKHYKDVGFAVGKGVLNGEKTTLVVALYGSKLSSGSLAATLNTPEGQAFNPLEQIGIGIQSLNAPTVGALTLLVLGIMISLLAHQYRRMLPKPLQTSWKRHHGLYKAVGMASVAVMIIIFYGSGQI